MGVDDYKARVLDSLLCVRDEFGVKWLSRGAVAADPRIKVRGTCGDCQSFQPEDAAGVVGCFHGHDTEGPDWDCADWQAREGE